MLSDIQLDALRELASIGAGHAATALSQLVDRKVAITCPELVLIPTAKVPYALGGPETIVAAIYVRVLGDVKGGLLFVLDMDSAAALAGLLRGDGAETELKASDQELLRHAGSMLLSAFVNALCRTARVSVVPGPPGYASDMIGAILESVAAETEGYADDAIVIDADFVEEEEGVVRGKLFFMPAQGSLETVARALGVE